jgi:outer membrane protein, heavy metal efflux system
MTLLKKRILFYFLTCSISSGSSLLFAQQAGVDTIHLSVSRAENIFLQKNLSLIAAHYDIDADKALISQAKLWDNPVLNTDQNIYDGHFFRHDKNYGQVYIQLQQLILTACKRNKLVQLAEDNRMLSEAQFNDLLRNLHFVLVSDINNLWQLQSGNIVYEAEIRNVLKLSEGMDAMFKLGDVAEKDNIRIKALLYSLQSDYLSNKNQQTDLQKEIHVLLQLSDSVNVIVDEPVADITALNQVNLSSLIDSAYQSRPDAALSKTMITMQQHNLSYQKALTTPDLTVGLEYDHASNYIPNYYGLTVSLPIPVLNRNKGNIAAAKINIKQAETQLQANQLEIDGEVTAAYRKLIDIKNFQSANTQQWPQRYDQLLQNMTESYRQRQVSLVDFIDFFDSYKQTRLQQLQQTAGLYNAMAELNFTVNQNIFLFN